MQKFFYELNSNVHDNVEVNLKKRNFATDSDNLLLIVITIKKRNVRLQ
jgi:hypothetical protein